MKILTAEVLQYFTPKFQKELKALTPFIKPGVEPRQLQRFHTVIKKVIDYWSKRTRKYYDGQYNRIDYKIPSEYDMLRDPDKFIRDIKPFIKKASYDKDLLKEYLQIAKDMKPVLKLISDLYAKQKKAKEKKEFPVSDKSAKAIRKILAEDADLVKLKTKLTKDIKETTENFLQALFGKPEVDCMDARYRNISGFVAKKISTNRGVKIVPDYPLLEVSDGKYKKAKNYPRNLREYSKDQAQQYLDDFIEKQVIKIGPVLDKSRKKYELVSEIRPDSRTPEGYLTVTYSDRSFKTLTQLVFGYSEHGNSFVRYPTTFHQIYRKNKLIKKKESYEWMNENFHKEK